MKNFFLAFLSLCLLLLTAAAVIGGLAVHHVTSDGTLPKEKLVLIERGQGVSTIAATLEKEGVISQPLLFKIVARFSDSLKAGEYQFPANISMANVIAMMETGEVFDRKITIPEGYTSYQIVKLLNERVDLKGAIRSIPAEGSLLPNTYHFVATEKRQDIIDRMQAAMKKTLDEAWQNRADNLPLQTKEDALILASIVEKETGVAKERARVAGVFINRLNKGMMLQTDPTVIYALTKGKIQNEGKGPLGRRLLRKDLKIDSPFNTYKNTGLTPTPIANPGRAAIIATLNPEKHDYIFFVADGTGGHMFAKTLAEHNRNVAKWRKVRSSR